MDLTDPALLIALGVGVALLALFIKLQTPGLKPPQCASCGRVMELDEEITDPENPEQHYVPGERRGWFRCLVCNRRIRARY